MGRLDCILGLLTMDPTRGSCFEPITELIKLHNARIPNVLRDLQRRLPGFKYSLFDSYTAGTEAMENPTKYGIKLLYNIFVYNNISYMQSSSSVVIFVLVNQGLRK